MATISSLAKGGSTTIGIGNDKTPVIVAHEIDIAAFVTKGGATTDYCTVMTIPAQTRVVLLRAAVTTATSLGASNRLDLGDTGSDTQWVSNHSTQTVGNMTLANTIKTYTTADTLRWKIAGATIATGKILVVAEVADLNYVSPAAVGTF